MTIKVKADGFVSFEKMLDRKVCYAVRFVSDSHRRYLTCGDKADEFWGLCKSNVQSSNVELCTKFLCRRSAESFAMKVRKMFQEYGNDHLKGMEVETVACKLSYYWRDDR